MSLISEALRKAGESQTSGSPSLGDASPRPPWVTGALLVGILGLVVVVSSRLAHSPHAGTSEIPSAGVTRPTPSPAQPSGLQLLRLAEGQWQLNGVVRGGQGKSLALINGEVVEEGSSIRGARVVRVAQDQVDVEENGQIRTLRLR